jgi:hypothetical protein
MTTALAGLRVLDQTPHPTRPGDKLSEHQHAGAEIVLLEGGIGIAPQRRGRFADIAGIALDLRFELDRRLVEPALPEGFVRCERRQKDKSNERGGKAGANETAHEMNPPAAAVRRSPYFRSGWCRGHGRNDATPPSSRCGKPPGHWN